MTESVAAVLARLDWHEDCGEARVELRLGVWMDLLVWIVDPEMQQQERLRVAGQALTTLHTREEAIRRWSADRITADTCNDPPLTADAIFDRLTVATLNVFDDGRAYVRWCDRGDLCCGHLVITRLDRTGECIEVSME
jgi:hypothetical protein